MTTRCVYLSGWSKKARDVRNPRQALARTMPFHATVVRSKTFQDARKSPGSTSAPDSNAAVHVGLGFANLLFERLDLLPKHNYFGEPILCDGFNFRGQLRWEL